MKKQSQKRRWPRSMRGLSLTELMIASAVITLGVLGVVGSFGGIARGVQVGKSRALSSNLCQEKMQILKQRNYYRVLVTTAPMYDTNFSPAVEYDNSYFPPETILEGGGTFIRYTYIQWAQEVSGSIVVLGPTSSDTGLKLITVTTAWRQGDEWKKIEIRSVMANPDAVVQNSVLTGYVRDVANVAIPNVTVTVSENSGWQDTTDNTGRYLINLYAGNYNINVGGYGYFTQVATVAIPSNTTVVKDVTLTQMSASTLMGTVWKNDKLLISQVMAATATTLPSGMSAEYVEVYNPTTWTWTMHAAGAARVGLRFQRRPAQDALPVDIDIDYSASTATLAPGRYFLFANTTTFHINGVAVQADAIWNNAVAGPNDMNFFHFDTTSGAEDYNIIPINTDGGGEGAGGLQLYEVLSGRVLDTFGWQGAGSLWPALYENYPLAENIGFQIGEQFTRAVSTAAPTHATWGIVADVYGRAYDFGDSDYNFYTQSNLGTILVPHNTLSPAKTNVAGSMTVNWPGGTDGGGVSANDGLSAPVDIYLTGINNGVKWAPRSDFVLPSVATGTWTVFYSSGSLYQELSSVTVTGGTLIGLPHAGTSPAWPVPGVNAIFLTSSTTQGYIIGTVRNVGGTCSAVIFNPAIVVTNGSQNTNANTTFPCRYSLRTNEGIYTVTANQGNSNVNFVSVSSVSVEVFAGQVTSGVDFVLSQAGGIRGFVTRDGINALPGIAVIATNAAGLTEAQAVTGSDGRFAMANVSTGAYTIEPVLGSGESAVPLASTRTVTVGASIFAGTFTVTGASGYLQGSVTHLGAPVKTGVLLVASTGTIVSLPVLSATNTLTGRSYYMASTYEDGTYSMELRGSTSTTYRVYAYYPVLSSGSWTTLTASSASVTILPGQIRTGVNFAW